MDDLQDLELPNRLIAAGEEPLGERVNVYHKMKTLRNILEAIDEDVMAFLSKTQFAKLLDLPSLPAWSATFGLFLLSRQLDVAKRNEIWVVFAGTPVRFSLREFKIATRLRCSKYPNVQKKRKKDTAGKQIPFYSTLFGLEDDITVERVISILKKNTVKDLEMRKRYACLAIVDGFLVPTSHYPKIIKAHAEMSEDLSAFISFPWGRLSFEMMMKSIKERDVEQLATTCVVVQGFLHGLQMVVLYAAPSIQEGAIAEGSIGSESEEEGTSERSSSNIVPLQLGNAKEIDQHCTVHVDPIIFPDLSDDVLGEDLSWSEDDVDPRVDRMVALAKEGFKKPHPTPFATIHMLSLTRFMGPVF